MLFSAKLYFNSGLILDAPVFYLGHPGTKTGSAVVKIHNKCMKAIDEIVI
jgi:hypothetical protein